MTNIRHFWVASNSRYQCRQLKQCEKQFFKKKTNHLQSKFTIIRPKNYKKSLLCGFISQTSAEMPPKNGGVRKAN
jgi:hypothetical protein